MVLEEEEGEEEDGAGGPLVGEEVTFSPVLIWKPGRGAVGGRRRGREEEVEEGELRPSSEGRLHPPMEGGGRAANGSRVIVKTMNLTEALPPERPDSGIERKVREGGWVRGGRGDGGRGEGGREGGREGGKEGLVECYVVLARALSLVFSMAQYFALHCVAPYNYAQ